MKMISNRLFIFFGLQPFQRLPAGKDRCESAEKPLEMGHINILRLEGVKIQGERNADLNCPAYKNVGNNYPERVLNKSVDYNIFCKPINSSFILG